MKRLLALGGAAAGSALAWGSFEAGWVRLRVRDCPVPKLPEALEGVRVAHLSDFHFGVPSRGEAAVERAVDWVVERRPDLVVVTGDLLTRPRGQDRLRRALARIPSALVVLGNHDVGRATDPFARASEVDVAPARLLRDEAATVEVRGRPVQVVGVDPATYLERRAHPERLVDAAADLRILLCHFPRVAERLPAGAFQLVLAGHSHDGQIAVPYGFGKVRLSNVGMRYPRGLFRLPAATMHVSPGLGTTFVPFRFFARPEATELVLQSA